MKFSALELMSFFSARILPLFCQLKASNVNFYCDFRLLRFSLCHAMKSRANRHRFCCKRDFAELNNIRNKFNLQPLSQTFIPKTKLDQQVEESSSILGNCKTVKGLKKVFSASLHARSDVSPDTFQRCCENPNKQIPHGSGQLLNEKFFVLRKSVLELFWDGI